MGLKIIFVTDWRSFLDRKYIFFPNIYSTIQGQVTAYALGWEPDGSASDEV